MRGKSARQLIEQAWRMIASERAISAYDSSRDSVFGRIDSVIPFSE
jgi:hypothetical protein